MLTSEPRAHGVGVDMRPVVAQLIPSPRDVLCSSGGPVLLGPKLCSGMSKSLSEYTPFTKMSGPSQELPVILLARAVKWLPAGWREWDYQPPEPLDPLLDEVSAAFTGDTVLLSTYHVPPKAPIPFPFTSPTALSPE